MCVRARMCMRVHTCVSTQEWISQHQSTGQNASLRLNHSDLLHGCEKGLSVFSKNEIAKKLCCFSWSYLVLCTV